MMKQIGPILFLILFVAIITFAIIYLSRRTAWIFNIERVSPLYILYTALVLLTFVSMIAFMHTTNYLWHIVYCFFTIFLGFLLYLLFSVIVTDIVSMIFKFKPVVFGIIAISMSCLITGYGLINASNIHIKYLKIENSKLDKSYRIVHLSDIHMGQFRGESFLEDIVEKTNSVKPDLVLITGDYADSRFALKPENFTALYDINAPVYFVNGNHDKETDDRQIKKMLRNVNVIVLENEIQSFESLQIVGLNNMIADQGSVNMHNLGKTETIKSVLLSLESDKDKIKILMHHSPDGIEYAEMAGIDLYLTGHTHGGQLFPVNLLNNIIFDYNKGLHIKNNMSIFVSQGLGTFGPPLRIGTQSEIVVIDLIAN